MSEALTVMVRGNLPIPVGCTPRQVRLAELALNFDPETQTLTEIVEKAGYSATTSTAMARRTLNAVGVGRATDALKSRQADSARGLAAIGARALKNGGADLDALEPRDRLAAGFKAYELAHNLGEHVQENGSADQWRTRLRRAIRLAYHFGRVAGRRPQDVVLSPDVIVTPDK